VALVYVDSSALVKLIDEPESAALRAFLPGADLVSCELALTEVSRALRRASAQVEKLPLEQALERTEEPLGGTGHACLAGRRQKRRQPVRVVRPLIVAE
jgi:predicted nucleic acid-binding protein